MTEASPDRGTLSFTVDKAGNMTQRTDTRGVVTSYTYDALNRLTAVAYRRYPNANGVGIGLDRLGKNLIRLDWHEFKYLEKSLTAYIWIYPLSKLNIGHGNEE